MGSVKPFKSKNRYCVALDRKFLDFSIGPQTGSREFRRLEGESIRTGSRKYRSSKVIIESLIDKTTLSIDQMMESIGMQKRTDG